MADLVLGSGVIDTSGEQAIIRGTYELPLDNAVDSEADAKPQAGVIPIDKMSHQLQVTFVLVKAPVVTPAPAPAPEPPAPTEPPVIS